MGNLRFVAALAVFCIFIVSNTDATDSNEKPYKVVCYLGSWANFRNGDGKFVIEDIDPFLCTHLVYAFAKLNYDNKIAAFDSYLDLKENWGLGGYQRFNELKNKNPELKTLLAIGGWNEGSIKYSQMAKNPSSRKVFVDSCVQYLIKYNFDGLDLDWEYPANRGGISDDKKNFVLLLKELKEAFKPHGFLLTAAVSAGQHTIDSAYDIPAVGKYLDFINLMAYDFHGGWDSKTGHNAPLYPRPEESAGNEKLNVDYAVKYWLKNGAPAQKLILGMPLYGRSFALQNPQANGLDAPVNGKGMAGPFTREPGFIGFHEICKMLQKETGWTAITDKYTQAPYAYKDRQWIGYDDVKSISRKVDYLRKMKLGGAMVWSIETDDFRGKCNGQRYPLMRAINAGLNDTRQTQLPEIESEDDNSIAPSSEATTSSTFVPESRPTTVSSTFEPTTKRTSMTTRTARTTTEAPRDMDLPCPSSGYFRHPHNCKQFYFCQSKSLAKDMGYRIFVFRCAAGTVFSERLRTCAFPDSVPECL